MFLNKIRNIFCVPDTKFVSATNQVERAGKRGNIFVGNNMSATICPQQWENKITETKKGGKITPIVLLSTAMFTCFNRPKNKNPGHNNSLSKPVFLRTLDLHCIFFFPFFF